MKRTLLPRPEPRRDRRPKTKMMKGCILLNDKVFFVVIRCALSLATEGTWRYDEPRSNVDVSGSD